MKATKLKSGRYRSNPTTMYKHYIRELTSEEQKYQAKINGYFSGLLKENQGSDD